MACVAVVLFAGHRAMGQNYGDITVIADAPFSGSYVHGYAELRFHVTNRSPDREHVVTIQLPNQSYGGGDHLRRLTRSVRVSPGTTASVSLFQPPLMLNGDGSAVVSIDGRRQRDMLSYAGIDYQGARSHWGWSGAASNHVLTSRGVGGVFRDGVQRNLTSGAVPTTHGHNPVEIIDGPDIAQWSTHWLGYSRFAGVALNADEFRRAPEPVRAALWRYVEVGGTLTVFGEIDVPRPWQDSNTVNHGIRLHNVGFGVTQIVPAGLGSIDKWGGPMWISLFNHWQATSQPLTTTMDVASANTALPVVENLTLPVRSMLALMIAFAVVIGPVNLIVLTRKRRAIWMLWTVPAISLATSAAVFGYAMLAEGTGASSRVAAVTLLDEVNQRATTLGWVGFYSPLTPGDGLRFDDATELTPMLEQGWRNGGTGRSIDWTSGQHLDSGWVSARVPAFFKLRKVERRLERLQVTRGDNGTISAVNGLGAPIAKLYVAGPDNHLYLAENVEAGASVVLKQHSVQLLDRDEPREIMAGNWIDPASRTDFDSMVPPKGYVAVMNGSPFTEPGLARVKTAILRSVVIGLLKDPVP